MCVLVYAWFLLENQSNIKLKVAMHRSPCYVTDLPAEMTEVLLDIGWNSPEGWPG